MHCGAVSIDGPSRFKIEVLEKCGPTVQSGLEAFDAEARRNVDPRKALGGRRESVRRASVYDVPEVAVGLAFFALGGLGPPV
jgi:hypothetical protein